MKNKVIFSFLSLFLLIGFSVQAQRTPLWVKKIDQGNFIQGIIAKQISSSVQVVSFYSHFTPYDLQKKEKLYFRFHSPSIDSSFFLKAEEIENFSYYRLESKPGFINKGIQTIGPIETDRFLNHYKIRPSNFGALLRFGGDQNNFLLPLVIYTDSIPNKIKYHKAVIKLNNGISGGEFHVYKGIFENNIPYSASIQSGRIGRKPSGGKFSIKIEDAIFDSYEGWVTVVFNLKKMDSIENIAHRFLFYRTPFSKI